MSLAPPSSSPPAYSPPCTLNSDTSKTSFQRISKGIQQGQNADLMARLAITNLLKPFDEISTREYNPIATAAGDATADTPEEARQAAEKALMAALIQLVADTTITSEAARITKAEALIRRSFTFTPKPTTQARANGTASRPVTTSRPSTTAATALSGTSSTSSPSLSVAAALPQADAAPAAPAAPRQLDLLVKVDRCVLDILKGDHTAERFGDSVELFDDRFIERATQAAVSRYCERLYRVRFEEVKAKKVAESKEKKEKGQGDDGEWINDELIDKEPTRVNLQAAFENIRDKEKLQGEQRSVMPQSFEHDFMPRHKHFAVDARFTDPASSSVLVDIGQLVDMEEQVIVRSKVDVRDTRFQPAMLPNGDYDLGDEDTFALYQASHVFLRWLCYQLYPEKAYISALNGRLIHSALDKLKVVLIGVDDIALEMRKSVPQFSRESIHSIPRGIVLYGPPGTGKTTVMKELLKNMGMQLVGPPLAAADFAQGIVGDSERLVNLLADRARLVPWQVCCLMIDEIDALAPNRSASGQGNNQMASTLNAILSVITGIKDAPNLILVGATNLLEQMDSAFNRRMEQQFFIGVINAKYREKWLEVYKSAKRDSRRRLVFAGDPTEAGLLEQLLLSWTVNFTSDAMMKLCKRLAIGVDSPVGRQEMYDKVLQTCANANIRLAGSFVCTRMKDGGHDMEAGQFIDIAKVIADPGQRSRFTGRIFIELPDTSDRIRLDKLQSQPDFDKRIQVENSLSAHANKERLSKARRLESALANVAAPPNEMEKNNILLPVMEVTIMLMTLDRDVFEFDTYGVDVLWLIQEGDAFLRDLVSNMIRTNYDDAEEDFDAELNAGFWASLSDGRPIVRLGLLELLGDNDGSGAFKPCTDLLTTLYFAWRAILGQQRAMPVGAHFKDFYYSLSALLLTRLRLRVQQVVTEVQRRLDFTSNIEAFSHASAFRASERRCFDAVLSTLLTLSTRAALDVVLFLDVNFFLDKEKTNEADMVLCMNQVVKECGQYNSSLVILDIDSLAEITRSDSTLDDERKAAGKQPGDAKDKQPSFRAPASYRILRESLFLLACRLMRTHARQDATSSHWVCAIVNHPELVSRFKFSAMWPKTEAELKTAHEQDQEPVVRMARCANCFQMFDAERNRDPYPKTCRPHHSKTLYVEPRLDGAARAAADSGGPTNITRFTYAEMKKLVERAKNDLPGLGTANGPDKLQGDPKVIYYPQLVKHSCCGKRWLEDGCADGEETRHEEMQ